MTYKRNKYEQLETQYIKFFERKEFDSKTEIKLHKS